MFKNFKNWISQNKLEFFLLVFIISFGGFLRLYQITGHATFLGDEGRDALVVKRMIVDHRFTLLGPTTSLGQMYLGPFYYYMMAIPMWLMGLDPAGPAVMVGLMGTLTIFMVWLLGREFFSPVAGITASALYAVSLLVINHTRSSWNPNPMPLFAALAIYGLFKSLKNKDGRWLVLVGASLGVAFQLHYISLVLIGLVITIFIFCHFVYKIRFRSWTYLAGVVSFLLVISPQILFELRHNFITAKALLRYLVNRGEGADAGLGLNGLMPVSLYGRLFVGLLTSSNRLIGYLLAAFTGLTALVLLVREKGWKGKNLGLFILVAWVLLGSFGVPLYEGKIHDHYLGFLFPTPFLLFGFVFAKLWENKKLKYLLLAGVLGLIIFDFSKTNIPQKVGPNYQIKRVKLVSTTIANDVGNETFNLALFSPTKDFQALHYRYFLELASKRPKDYGEYQNIDNLYVIVEVDPRTPEELGLWEVGTFGSFKREKEWSFDFQVKLYKITKETE